MILSKKAIVLTSFLSLAYHPVVALDAYGIIEAESPTQAQEDSRHKQTIPSNIVSVISPTKYLVEPLPKKKPSLGLEDKIIYLTFDDGPISRGTRNVANVLRDEGVAGTMFFVGKHVKKRRKLYRNMAARPNLLIANHTYSHANGKYAKFYSMGSKAVLRDIDRAQNRIGGAKYLRLAGRNVWRLPHIHRNDYALSKYRRSIERPKYNALSDSGYQIFGWDIEWHYNSKGSPRYSENQMLDRIEAIHRHRHTASEGKLILLAHDFMFRSHKQKAQLKHLIVLLRKNGWQFASLSSYDDAAVGAPMEIPREKEVSPLESLDMHLVSAEANGTISAEKLLKIQLLQTPLQENTAKVTEG